MTVSTSLFTKTTLVKHNADKYSPDTIRWNCNLSNTLRNDNKRVYLAFTVLYSVDQIERTDIR